MPAIDALAQRCRVVTFSLADEPSCGGRFDEAHGFDCYVDQVREALDTVGLTRAAICGVSYGGLIAAAFAARYPDRTSSLVLVSALLAVWRPNARVRFYLRAPRLLTPLFMLRRCVCIGDCRGQPGTVPGVRAGATACLAGTDTHVFTVSDGAPCPAPRIDRPTSGSTRCVVAPTLIVTGEPATRRRRTGRHNPRVPADLAARPRGDDRAYRPPGTDLPARRNSPGIVVPFAERR